jgi:hypothetical protein
MQTNPFPDETTSERPTDILPPMDALQPRQTAQNVPVTPQPVEGVAQPEAAESSETRQETGQAVAFGIAKFNDYLQWVAIVLEVILAIRFVLRLIGADPNNAFASFLYAVTGFILTPFSNIVATPSLGPHHYQAFEWPTLIAMAIYWLAFWALRRFLHIIISSPEEPVE